jgi:ribosomal protein S18 acetylase RimI-like enzyme
LTDPAWRGRGLGSAGGTALIELLRQRGYTDIRLGVNSDNQHAQQLYERLGFTRIAERELLLSRSPLVSG